MKLMEEVTCSGASPGSIEASASSQWVVLQPGFVRIFNFNGGKGNHNKYANKLNVFGYFVLQLVVSRCLDRHHNFPTNSNKLFT